MNLVIAFLALVTALVTRTETDWEFGKEKMKRRHTAVIVLSVITALIAVVFT